MQIIKQGFIPEETTIFEGTCRHCGCVIRGPKKDWIRKDYHNLQGGLQYIFKCPTINCIHTIIGEEI